MADDAQKTGTPTPDATDAAGKTAQTGGTLGKDGRDAGDKGTDDKLHLQWKDKAEKYNAEKERGDRLEAELKRLGSRQPPEQKQPDGKVGQRAAVKAFADGGDPVSQEVIDLREDNKLMLKAMADAEQLRRMPDAEQDAVLEHYLANQHRLGDPKAARAEIREKALAEETGKLKEENERLSKALADHAAKAGRQPDPDVVRTHVREAHASEFTGEAKEMTAAQFDSEISRLRAAGQHGQVMKLQRQLERDEIVFTG